MGKMHLSPALQAFQAEVANLDPEALDLLASCVRSLGISNCLPGGHPLERVEASADALLRELRESRHGPGHPKALREPRGPSRFEPLRRIGGTVPQGQEPEDLTIPEAIARLEVSPATLERKMQAPMSFSGFLAHFKSHGRPDIEAVIASTGDVTADSFEAVGKAVFMMNQTETVELEDSSVYVRPATRARIETIANDHEIELADLVGALVDLATGEQLLAAARMAHSEGFYCTDCVAHFERMECHVEARREVEVAAL